MRVYVIGGAAMFLGFAGSALARAADTPQPVPPQFGRLIACQSITGGVERLGCFDREAAKVASALNSNDLVVIDREAVRSSKRTLFGLPIPSLGVFGNDKEEIAQVEGTVDAIGRNGDGGYVLILADGARWSQTDDRQLAVAPRRGSKVVVKRGAFGSYNLAIDRQPGIKVKRVN
jgi:hypothetical protein